ncbi:hypothetical protein HY639_01975 [Candidatus Woesearchaeota archaeon]|nr:hypothetical protein [Candidatus Woesearchaeota archaeon]
MDSINSIYRDSAMCRMLHARFVREHSIQLQDFLKPAVAATIRRDLLSVGTVRTNVPHRHAYALIQGDGPFLPEWLAWLRDFVGTYRLARKSILVFGHRDYTLLHDRQDDGLHALFELTSNWDASWGGYTSVARNGKELVRIDPVPLSLSLFRQKSQARSFVKYINHHAGRTKRVVVHLLLR